jgi:undecaprenyl-phosphate 4-deoxy-4-formamido-L-arabinose transferase
MTVPADFKISIVIPVYNAEKTIGALVAKLVDFLSPQYNLEIILVNDRSRDKTEDICIALYERYRNLLKFYSLSKNVGEHGAVMAGLNKSTGEYVVIMDDDFQNPVEEVPRLINEALRSGNDVIYSYYEEKKHAFYRNLGSRFNDKVANVLLNKPKDLYLSSFKVINRFLVNEIIKYEAPFPYIDGLILQLTDRIGRVRVEHHERKEGKSGYTLKKLVSLWLNMFTNFSVLPLRISTILGFSFSLLGAALGIYTVVERLMNPDIPVGYASLFVVIAIFSGVQLIMLGMVGEYVGRLFLSMNRKPQYTVRKAYE